ncbi:MAG TPA: CDP-alcohol phosphatidyltransferase family protein [Thermoanaerobaculia bacterium]|nr:CDP-alcohol phosphatidyltransferase family protein [Thermoanaerobaculia bacterium]
MKFTIPNLISVLRMGLVPLFIIAVLEGQSLRALILFLVAGLTDALDGFIARFANQQSLLGAYLDPIADKILLTAAYIALTIPSLNHGVQIPVWITVLVIGRDVLLVVVGLILYLAGGIRKFPVTILSKINTAIQVAAVLVVLLSALSPHLESIATTLLYLVAVLTISSGLDYVIRYSRSSGQPASGNIPPQ